MRLLLSLAAVAIAKERVTEVKWGQLRSLLTRKSQLTAGLGPKMSDKYLKILDFFVLLVRKSQKIPMIIYQVIDKMSVHI